MAKTVPLSGKDGESFYADILEEGYHIFSLKSAEKKGFYPNKFPNYPGVHLEELTLGDKVTIRAFFHMGGDEPAKIESGLIDLEVEFIDTDRISGLILTRLPNTFPLGTGGSLEIFEDEILYKQDPSA